MRKKKEDPDKEIKHELLKQAQEILENAKKENLNNAIEYKVRCLEKKEFETESGNLLYEYSFFSILEEDDNPEEKELIELKVIVKNPIYKTQKFYYFTLQTKLRD